jgi:hypothetical protein
VRTERGSSKGRSFAEDFLGNVPKLSTLIRASAGVTERMQSACFSKEMTTGPALQCTRSDTLSKLGVYVQTSEDSGDPGCTPNFGAAASACSPRRHRKHCRHLAHRHRVVVARSTCSTCSSG